MLWLVRPSQVHEPVRFIDAKRNAIFRSHAPAHPVTAGADVENASPDLCNNARVVEKCQSVIHIDCRIVFKALH